VKYAPFAAALALLSAEPVLASEASAETGDQDKIVCKRLVDTGSLVRGKRVCKTRQEWGRSAQGAREKTQAMQEAGRINTMAPK
jgi:hypothetical protein